MIPDKSIHVLHIVSGDLWAGAEAQLFTLAHALLNDPSIRVSVVILNHGKLEQKLGEAGIKTIVLDESQLNSFRLLLQLTRTVRNLKPDVIHTHRIKENILGTIAARFNSNIPGLRTAHGAPEHLPAWHQLPKRLILYVDWFCGRFLQHSIISVSTDLASILQRSYPLEKIHIIENGIDLKTIRKHEVPKNMASENHGLKVGIAGRLVPVKRVDIFIQTARYILDNHPDLKITFHIFGDGPLRSKLEQLSSNIKTNNMVFFEGHCENISAELQQIDALIMTSDHEGLPMVLLEAMALGTPIIANAVGGIPQLLNHGACGILVNRNTAPEYAIAINQLVTRQEMFSELTRKAAHRIKQEYSATKNAQAYKSQYLSLLK